MSDDISSLLAQAFDAVIQERYGSNVAPTPYIVPWGVRHLDALLGGGLVSSAPVIFSSTPETGKSTLAMQFAKLFQDRFKDSVVVYLDVEAAGKQIKMDSPIVNRMSLLNIDSNRLRYSPIIVDIQTLFNIIDSICKVKDAFEKKVEREFNIMIIWDSIAATPSSKIQSVDDPNSLVGFKARQLTFCIEKYAPLLAYKKIFFLCIDQVRANLVVDVYAQREKTVGVFKDYRSATAVQAWNHRISQWLFLSRKATITPDMGMNVNGWFLDIFVEKNKYAPSQESVTCVFDKRYGLHPFWSEFVFLSEMTPSEKRYFKKEDSLMYPLTIHSSGSWYYLEIISETGEVEYTSEKFHRKDAYDKYLHDSEFRQAFDYAVDVAVKQRIYRSIFQIAGLDDA